MGECGEVEAGIWRDKGKGGDDCTHLFTQCVGHTHVSTQRQQRGFSYQRVVVMTVFVGDYVGNKGVEFAYSGDSSK